jgi:hypothetical protein
VTAQSSFVSVEFSSGWLAALEVQLSEFWKKTIYLLKNAKKSLQNSQFMHNKINFGYTGCFYGSVAVRRSA